MNEQLQAQLSQILAQIMISVGEVKDFSVAQLPDIVQQYIQYGFWVTTFWIVTSALAIVLSLVSLFVIHRIAERTHDDSFYGLFAAPVVVIMVCGAALMNNIHSIILLLNAPKIWFIFEIKNLLK